jgi:hypothetical protein
LKKTSGSESYRFFFSERKTKEQKRKQKIQSVKNHQKTQKEVTTMTFIDPKELGLYAPKTNEQVKLAAEAQKHLNQAIFTYKQLFYGLQSVAWKYRDKHSTFYDALSSGELDEFKLAPGRRAPDGSYTKDEWDYDRLNAYMWNRFRERFDASFNLERISQLKTLKDIQRATNELLEFALANWGEAVLTSQLEEEEPIEPIGQGVTRCQLQYRDIQIQGHFWSQQRTLTLLAEGVPEVVIKQTKGETSWKGGISFDTWGQPVSLNSQKAAAFGEMLELAARLNLGIKEFMANPEGFLGIESAQSHQRNLQRMKQRLLEINQDNYERRKAEAEQKAATRRINEAIDAAEAIADDPDATEEELEAARHQASMVWANEHPKRKQQGETTPVTVKQRKRQRQQEADEWLQNHPEFLEDVDA